MKVFSYIIMLLIMPAPAVLAAGVVQSLDARATGDVAFVGGAVTVTGQTVPWDAVVYVLPQGRVRTPVPVGAVRLPGGEVWAAEILGCSAGKAKLRLALFGQREVEAAMLATLEFAPSAARAEDLAPGTLYRDKGEPVPGTLLWVDATRMAIDSPLGVLTLARDGAVRYVFARARPAAKPAAAVDAVGLVDGTVLFVRAKPAAGGLVIEHPVLGAITVPAAAIRFVARKTAKVVDLVEGAAPAVTSAGLIGGGSQAPAVEFRRAEDGPADGGAYLDAIVVQPKSIVKYRLPEGGAKATFSARLRPVEAARGDVRVRVTAGGQVLADHSLAAGAAAVSVAVDVSAGGDLAIEVDFGKRLAFPSGVRIEDPLVVMR